VQFIQTPPPDLQEEEEWRRALLAQRHAGERSCHGGRARQGHLVKNEAEGEPGGGLAQSLVVPQVRHWPWLRVRARAGWACRVLWSAHAACAATDAHVQKALIESMNARRHAGVSKARGR